jgi:hypothetical protein
MLVINLTSTARNFPGDGHARKPAKLCLNDPHPILEQFPANEPSIPLDTGEVGSGASTGRFVSWKQSTHLLGSFLSLNHTFSEI